MCLLTLRLLGSDEAVERQESVAKVVIGGLMFTDSVEHQQTLVRRERVLKRHRLSVGDAELGHELLSPSKRLSLLVEMDHMLIHPNLETANLNLVIKIYKIFLKSEVIATIEDFMISPIEFLRTKCFFRYFIT